MNRATMKTATVPRSLAAGALFAAVLLFGTPATVTAESSAPKPIHEQPQQLEDRLLETVRSLIRGDTADASRKMVALRAGTRELRSEEADPYGYDVIAYSLGIRRAIDRSRELALAGQPEDAFNQFVWVQRSCIACHAAARDLSLMPEPEVRKPE